MFGVQKLLDSPGPIFGSSIFGSLYRIMDQDASLQVLFGVIAAVLSLLGIWATWKFARGMSSWVVNQVQHY